MDHGEKMFKRGRSWHMTGTTVSSSDYGGVEREGTRRSFKDQDTATYNLRARRTGGDVVCIAVRNVAACVLRPKRLVTWKSGSEFRRVDGYACETAEMAAGVVDEFYAAGGVQVGDLFWLQVRGPTLMLTPEVSNAAWNGDISALNQIVCASAGTSAATTAADAQGRVAKQNITCASTTSNFTGLFNQIQNRVGRAMSARTTAETSEDILVNLEMW